MGKAAPGELGGGMPMGPTGAGAFASPGLVPPDPPPVMSMPMQQFGMSASGPGMSGPFQGMSGGSLNTGNFPMDPGFVRGDVPFPSPGSVSAGLIPNPNDPVSMFSGGAIPPGFAMEGPPPPEYGAQAHLQPFGMQPFTPSGQASPDMMSGAAIGDPGGFAPSYSLTDIINSSGREGWGSPGTQPPTTNDVVAGGQGPPPTPTGGPPSPTPTARDTPPRPTPRPYRGRPDDIASGPTKADPTTAWQPNWNQASLLFRAMAPRPVAGAGMFPPLPSVPGDPPRTDPPFRAGYRPGQRT